MHSWIKMSTQNYNEVSYFTHENETKQMTVFMYTEYWSVLEEQCCPTQLHPLTLGPPTRHVQTRNKFVSITTGVYW